MSNMYELAISLEYDDLAIDSSLEGQTAVLQVANLLFLHDVSSSSTQPNQDITWQLVTQTEAEEDFNQLT